MQTDKNTWFNALKRWASTLKRDVYAVWLAGRDPRTPTLAKVIAIFTAAYAFSPIDLIPDFIPVLGYLDDMVIVPFGILLVIRLIPGSLLSEFRAKAQQSQPQSVSYVAAAVIVAVWMLCAVILGVAVLR